MKERRVPITGYDEKILEIAPTEDEIKAAKHLPYPEILGVMSFPASCCKFEMKYSISVLVQDEEHGRVSILRSF